MGNFEVTSNKPSEEAMLHQKCLDQLATELQQAKLDIEHWRTVDGHVEKLESELQQAREEIKLLSWAGTQTDAVAALSSKCSHLQQQLAQSQANEKAARQLLGEPTFNAKTVKRNWDLEKENNALQARLDEAVGLLEEWRNLFMQEAGGTNLDADTAAFLAAQQKETPNAKTR